MSVRSRCEINLFCLIIFGLSALIVANWGIPKKHCSRTAIQNKGSDILVSVAQAWAKDDKNTLSGLKNVDVSPRIQVLSRAG